MSIWITRLSEGRRGNRVAVKDLFDTDGVRTTYGTKVFENHVPTETAAAVRLLEENGWLNVGKANLHEFAFGITSQNQHYGDVPNPRFPALVAGGSSGGSAAALVTDEADLGLGTDSGGSIRIPAACCEVVGFKPSFGAVPVEGCFPLAPSFDHVGPIARDVRTCAGAFRVLAGVGPEPLGDLGDLRIGLAWAEHAQPEVRRVFEATATKVLPHAAPARVPLPDGTYAAFQREIAKTHSELFAKHADLYGRNVRTKIGACLAITEEEAAAAREARERYRDGFADALSGYDLVLVPTMPIVPPPQGADDLDVRARMTLLTFPLNVVGAPALALPFGQTEAGLPVSAQLVARPGADGLVLAAAALLESALRHTALPETESQAD